MTSPVTPRKDPGNSRSFARAVGLATAPDTAERPYLGDYSTIDGLVRAMLAEELERAADRGAGTLSDEDYGQQTLASVRRMRRIFTGADARYTPMPGWNTEPTLVGSRNLTSAINERLASVVAPASMATAQQAAEALFSVALLEWREGLDAFSRSGDADQLQALGNELTENYTRLLLGLPPDDDSDL